MQSFHPIKPPHILKDYQKDVIKYILKQESEKIGTVLEAAVGWGKTLVMLQIIAITKIPTLVITTKILIDTVMFEVDKFFGGSLPASILHSDHIPKPGKYSSFKQVPGSMFILTTYDVIVRLYNIAVNQNSNKNSNQKMPQQEIDFAQSFFMNTWGRIVADESQRFISSKTKLWKALMVFKPCFRLCMTGTPIKKDDKDIKTQMEFTSVCGKSERLKISLKESNICLPNILTHKHHVKLTPEEYNNYKSKEKNLAEYKCRHAQKEIPYFKVRIAIKSLREAACFCSKSKLSSKVNMLSQIFSKIQKKDKILIFCTLSFCIRELKKRITTPEFLFVDSSNKKQKELIRCFQTDNRIRGLFITSGIGSLGLNLSEANHIVFCEYPMSESPLHKQMIGRVYRLGQTKEVHVHYIISNDTFEYTLSNLKETNEDFIKH